MGVVTPRVVITGLGIASPLGSDIDHVWSALLDGRSGATRLNVDGLGQITHVLPRESKGGGPVMSKGGQPCHLHFVSA